MAEFLARQRIHASISFEDYRANKNNPKGNGGAKGGTKLISQTELDHDNSLRKEVRQRVVPGVVNKSSFASRICLTIHSIPTPT